MPACQGLDASGCSFNSSGDDVSCTVDGSRWLCTSCERLLSHDDDTTHSKQHISNSQGKSHPLSTDDNEEKELILQPLLAYCACSIMSSSSENVKNAVVSYFSREQILTAKQVLWLESDNSVIGEKHRRKDSTIRSEKEANAMDIVNALIKLDEANKMPCFVVDASNLRMIPQSNPEEMNNISIVDRLNVLEMKFHKIHDVVEKSLNENFALNEKLSEVANICRAKHKTYSETVSSTRVPQVVVTPPNPHLDQSIDQPQTSASAPKLPQVVDAPLNVSKCENEGQQNNAAHSVTSQKVHAVATSLVPPRPSSLRGRGYGRSQRGRGQAHGRGGRFGSHISSQENRLSSYDNISRSVSSHISEQSNESDQTSLGFNTEDFQVPAYHKRKERRERRFTQRKVISGKGTDANFKGGPSPIRELFIYRVDKSTDVDTLHQHIANLGITINALTCTSHKDAKFSSYKLTVPKEEFSLLFNEDYWPKGVMVRQYIPHKSSTDKSW